MVLPIPKMIVLSFASIIFYWLQFMLFFHYFSTCRECNCYNVAAWCNEEGKSLSCAKNNGLFWTFIKSEITNYKQ
jgi:hypothetical protein